MEDQIEMEDGYFSIAPLEAIARAKADRSGMTWSNETFAQITGFSSRAVSRWRSSGGRILWSHADRAAINLNLHPLNIWGDDWLRPDKGIMDGTDKRGLALIEEAMDRIGEKLAEDQDADISVRT